MLTRPWALSKVIIGWWWVSWWVVVVVKRHFRALFGPNLKLRTWSLSHTEQYRSIKDPRRPCEYKYDTRMCRTSQDCTRIYRTIQNYQCYWLPKLRQIIDQTGLYIRTYKTLKNRVISFKIIKDLSWPYGPYTTKKDHTRCCTNIQSQRGQYCNTAV